jgi:hypothetical protein
MATGAWINPDTALQAVAAQLREGMSNTIDRSLAQMRVEVPEVVARDDDPDFVELYGQSFRQQLRYIYDRLEADRDIEAREPPSIVAEEARQAVNLGIKLRPFLLAYRIFHRRILEDAIDSAQEQLGDPQTFAACLRVTSRWLFTYFDWVTVRVTDIYQQERELMFRNSDRRKRQLVRDLLEDEPFDKAQLRYELAQDHIAVVAWGHEPERALSALAESTGFDLLTISGTESTDWAWLGWRKLDKAELRSIHSFEPPAGAFLALGEPGRGLDGFRLSHRQAWSAYRIARHSPAPMTRYAEIALVGLTFQDPNLAREFVLRELGPLADEDERSELLRTTLSTYFAAGNNAASTAAALGVHDRTVLYRIRSIEDRLGYAITSRREELGVALRLAPMVL